jgi:flagellar basal-body rod modification protein FlgD
LGYVGQYIEAPSDGKLAVQNGSAKMAYTLPSEATSAKIYVKDANGKVVATMDGMTTKGLNRAIWDGTLDAGGKASDGVYSFSITAKDSKGETMKLEDIRVIGQVTGVETNASGETVLKVGSLEVKDSKVLSVFGSVASNGGSGGTKTSTDTDSST